MPTGDLRRYASATVNFGPFSKSYSYTYAANGNKASFTAPDGVTYSYKYNTANKLSEIQIPGVGPITLNTYEWQQPTRVSFPGGVSGEYTFDALQRSQSITIKDPAKNPS